MKVLMIDNYDSFTYNLVQYFGELGAQVETIRNDAITPEEILSRNPAMRPDRIVISPGPCSPAEAGISVALIQQSAGKIPLLGVCLGHQAIGAAFGGKVIRAQTLMHGKTSAIEHTGQGVFQGLPSRMTVIRYHSLALERETLPAELIVTAWTADGEIMGLQHRTLPVHGVQFHPESILSEHGHAMLKISSITHNTPLTKHDQNHRTGLPMAFTIAQALNRVVAHQDLTHEEMIDIMRAIMSGDASPVQTAGVLTALRVKVETTTEVAAAATVMREFATQVEVNVPHLVDMCGTGGDGAQTFNISTAAMFVAAAAGANVAKHGGRSVSSATGSADILEKLGASIHLAPEKVAESIRQCGVGFMFAPNYHPAMKHIAPVRKELGVRTIFNILGPLTNPANAAHQLMGVFHPELVAIQAEVLRKLGSNHVLVVHARSGLDEIALHGETMVGELKFGHVQHYSITAQQFGFPSYSVQECDAALRAASPQESESKLKSALDNEIGPARDIVALNAAGALLASNVVSDWPTAVDLAMKTIASGAAKAKLARFISVSQSLAA